MKESLIKAVHRRDLKRLLASLGVLDEMREGKTTCLFCGQSVTLDSMTAVFPYQGGVCFCCGKPGCCSELLDRDRDVTAYG